MVLTDTNSNNIHRISFVAGLVCGLETDIDVVVWEEGSFIPVHDVRTADTRSAASSSKTKTEPVAVAVVVHYALAVAALEGTPGRPLSAIIVLDHRVEQMPREKIRQLLQVRGILGQRQCWRMVRAVARILDQ
jgi:hypothetical protein